MLASDALGGKRLRLAEGDVSAASADDGDALDHHPTQAPASSSSAADLSPSAPLPPPAFDLLDRVTKVKTTGDIGTVQCVHLCLAVRQDLLVSFLTGCTVSPGTTGFQARV